MSPTSSFPVLPVALALLFAGCARSEDGAPPPLGSLQFPTGIAITPEDPTVPTRLLVVSSNFDLRFRSGVLHAFDLATLDRLIEEAPPNPACPAANPSCAPVNVPDITSAFVGAVEIGDYGGQVAVAQLAPGLQRAFVPVRGSNSVVAADLDASRLACSFGGTLCVTGGASFPRPDPYSIVVSLGNLYVGHFSTTRISPTGGVIGTAKADAHFWSLGGGALQTIDVGNTAIGGLAAGGCRPGADGAPICTLYASGRSMDAGNQQVFLFDFQAGVPILGPLFSRNLAPQENGADSRGIAVSSDAADVFLATHFPAALAVIDVTRIPSLPTDGCILPEGTVVPPGAACPELPPATGETPRFATADQIPSPIGPNSVVTIPRTLPDGSPSDLVAVTTTDGIAFFDMRVGVLAGFVTGLGGTPSELAVRPNGAGVRIYTPSFSQGTIGVVDLLELFRPESARVVARLGRVQEGAF
ncbi:hypothetical protein [Vulgatibacter incomptus]|uniref:Lipoprotein n=1 Tax=Vulgatibacter incomptus TaxID=1391653 RepID=A0A0K1PEH7_9BACT|nr:hypothetical protein [Vulgatibacter incomptus]AKU91529.1 hypothetical protein AKJ08_1916 [Vulgatibacter incomptus]